MIIRCRVITTRKQNEVSTTLIQLYLRWRIQEQIFDKSVKLLYFLDPTKDCGNSHALNNLYIIIDKNINMV